MTITLTTAQLRAICPGAPAGAVAALNAILARTQSITDLRAAMLVVQLAVRSDSFTRLEEQDGSRRASTPYFGRRWIQLSGLRRASSASITIADPIRTIRASW